MNFLQVLSVTLLVFSCIITFSQGEFGESDTPDAIIQIRLACPFVPPIEPSTEPVTEPTPSSPQPLTEPSSESTSPPFQPSTDPESTLPSSQPPPYPTVPPPSHSPQPPPPCSHQPFPPDSHQPFPPGSHQPPPGSYQPFPPNSHQPFPPGSNQPPSSQPFQPPPPYSPQPSPSLPFHPSTSCPLNSDYRQPIVTMTGFKTDNSSYLLSRWYFPQPPSNFQTIIEYTIDGNTDSVYCENGQLETIQNHDLMMSSLSGLCTLQVPLTNQLETYAIKFDINNEVKYPNYHIGNERQWMYDSKELLGDLSLSELVIPGTHESAAYPTPDVLSSLGDSQDTQHGVLHQNQSIDIQLQGGIRYFDLRPARFDGSSTGEYVLMNGLQEPVLLSVVAKQITTFIENSLEIVIVSFRDFSQGFNYKTHHKIFINHLGELFGKHAYTYRSITPKLNNIWRSNRRLILHYHDSMYTFRNFLWPAIPQIEKNFGYPGNEPSYKQQKKRKTLQAIIPQLLPEGQDLRSAIENLSTAIFNWATGVGRSDVNIIAVDYYDTTGVVDLAIQLNQERAREKACIKWKKQNLGFFGWDRN